MGDMLEERVPTSVRAHCPSVSVSVPLGRVWRGHNGKVAALHSSRWADGIGAKPEPRKKRVY